MKISNLTSEILKFASDNKSGYTLNIRTLQPVTSGYIVSYKATQNSFKAADVQRVIEHALKHDGIIGGWFNEKNKRYYFDSNKIFNNLAKAINFAIENEQIAIFDIDNMHEIRLDEKL